MNVLKIFISEILKVNSSVNSCAGLLWCSFAVFCCFSQPEAIKFQADESTGQTIDGDECGDTIFCSYLCSAKNSADTNSIL